MGKKKKQLNQYNAGDIVKIKDLQFLTDDLNLKHSVPNTYVNTLIELAANLQSPIEIEIIKIRPSMTKNENQGVYKAMLTANNNIKVSSCGNWSGWHVNYYFIQRQQFDIWDAVLTPLKTVSVSLKLDLLDGKVFKFDLPDVPSPTLAE